MDVNRQLWHTILMTKCLTLSQIYTKWKGVDNLMSSCLNEKKQEVCSLSFHYCDDELVVQYPPIKSYVFDWIRLLKPHVHFKLTLDYIFVWKKDCILSSIFSTGGLPWRDLLIGSMKRRNDYNNQSFSCSPLTIVFRHTWKNINAAFNSTICSF